MNLSLYTNIRKSSVWPALRSTSSMAIFKCFLADAGALHPTKASMQQAIIMDDDHHCWATFTNNFSRSKLQLIFIPNFYLFHTLHELKSIKNHWKTYGRNYLRKTDRSKNRNWIKFLRTSINSITLHSKKFITPIDLEMIGFVAQWKMVKMLNRLT